MGNFCMSSAFVIFASYILVQNDSGETDVLFTDFDTWTKITTNADADNVEVPGKRIPLPGRRVNYFHSKKQIQRDVYDCRLTVWYKIV